MDTRIIFFGTEAFSLSALQALVENGLTPELVITKPDSPSGRGMHTREPVVKTYAAEHGVRVLQPARLADVADDIAAVVNRIGVLSSYGKIIPDATLALFERGIINIHPSLLPKYRGPSPIETAIMNGDHETGITLMRLASAMDAGPIYTQRTIPLAPDVRADGLQQLCAQTGAQLLIDNLPAIVDGSLTARPQDDALATYTHLLNTSMTRVDPAEQTAAQIDRHVRAYCMYPRTKLTVSGHTIIATKTHVGEGGLTLACKDNTRLSVDELIAPSGKTMSGGAFSRGYTAE